MASKIAKIENPQVIIPMTGISSRFTAAGYTKPKFLLEVEEQTVLEHVIDMFPGWDDFIFVCNEEHLRNPDWNLEQLILKKRPHANIVSAPNSRLGPGAAILEAKEYIAQDKPVVVNYCDFASYWDANDFARKLFNPEIDGLIAVYTGFHPHLAFTTAYAYPKLVDGKVVDIQEKQPWTHDPTSEYISSGTYGFGSGEILLDALEDQIRKEYKLGEEYYVSLTYKSMLDQKKTIDVYEIQHFMQWGTPQDFEEYRDFSKAIALWSDRPHYGQDLLQNTSKVILASGSGSRFAAAGYKQPKPLLDLLGKPLIEHVFLNTCGGETVMVARDDLLHAERIEEYAYQVGAQCVSLPTVSGGQAVSALAGLQNITHNGFVTVAACDALALVRPETLEAVQACMDDETLVAWIAGSYHLAWRKPQQYGWVALDEDKNVRRSWLKQAPDEKDAAVMLGNFSFSSAEFACESIERLMKSGTKINGEFYLDSLVDFLRKEGKKVVGMSVDSFVSAGTPVEYETLKYWISCFHKTPVHPYSVTRDAFVDRASRTDLDAEFRTFAKGIRL